MDDYLGNITDNLISTLTTQVKKKKNRDKIMKNIVEPVLKDINNKYYPHYITIISLFIMMIIMLITLLFVVFWTRK
jgi:hypothetical protein